VAVLNKLKFINYYHNLYMLTRCLKSLANSRLIYSFSTGAVRDQINYYDILDVEAGAT